MSIATFSIEEVSKHNKEEDIWVIINNKIYDLSKFAKIHPGGKGVLLPVAGKDCTKEFYALHCERVLSKYGPKLLVGHVQNTTPMEMYNPADLSPVPYGESSGFTKGFHTPYYNESHRQFRKAIRQFIAEKILPYADDWEENGSFPVDEIYKKMGDFGLLAAQCYPGEHLKGINLPNNLPYQEYDYFHELIGHQELSRVGCPGLIDGLKAGFCIGLPPVIKFAKKQVAEKVVKECLRGEKKICLAISDSNTGSDVANLTCTAKISECGKFYIVNGHKKWITNGTFADYFVTAVRTGDQGILGVSMLLIERSEGLSTKLIKTSYSPCAGTAYIIFDNVKVPIENLLGEQDLGFQIIMSNFNHERWLICCGLSQCIRSIIDQCFRWCHQREAFGKKLISQPVIRQKLAHMIAQVEGLENWLENLTYQMTKMTDKQQFKYIGGQIALLKLQSTRTACFVSDNACQIFGGRAITRSGMGQIIERFQKTFKFYSIYGGSEEIMADLGIKQAIKSFPNHAKL